MKVFSRQSEPTTPDVATLRDKIAGLDQRHTAAVKEATRLRERFYEAVAAQENEDAARREYEAAAALVEPLASLLNAARADLARMEGVTGASTAAERAENHRAHIAQLGETADRLAGQIEAALRAAKRDESALFELLYGANDSLASCGGDAARVTRICVAAALMAFNDRFGFAANPRFSVDGAVFLGDEVPAFYRRHITIDSKNEGSVANATN